MKRSTLWMAVVLAGLTLLAYGPRRAAWAEDKPAVPASLDFALEDQEGKKVRLGDYADKTVVLEWINPGCPYVQRHYKAGTMADLAKAYREKGVVWLAINSTSGNTAAGNKRWVEQHQLPYAILNDGEGTVGKQYGAKTTPHLFVVRGGKIAYQGAIDDDPQGNKGAAAVNYVRQALDEVLAGKAVSTPETRPYGCGVKYR